MPELPEVEVVRRGLDAHLPGRTIETAEVLHPRLVRRDPLGADGFADRLAGHGIEAIRRRGKYFWLALDSGDAILGHLGMSGQMLLQPPGKVDERHLRVRFALSPRAWHGEPSDPLPLELRFVDQRMFGGLLFSPGGAQTPSEIDHIALDALDPDFDDAEFVRRVRTRTAGIKRLLLDQGLVSGIGNIYADEALWAAGIHGERPGERLTRAQVQSVLDHARDVMRAALAVGGTSFDALYVNVNGESGYFERALNAYGREGAECRRCGVQIVRRQFMNRSSFFCPSCQKAPRSPRAHR